MSVQTGHVVNLASDRVTQQSGDGQNFSDQIQYPQYLTVYSYQVSTKSYWPARSRLLTPCPVALVVAGAQCFPVSILKTLVLSAIRLLLDPVK
ncbi:hypothetical protein QTP88_025627 [Uroleucon formosanum]